tara:strand:+ start:11079 stop:11315 length:237 start_codon:yes stop_codon:yes gene_type:complete
MKKINKDHLEKIQDQQKKLNEIIQQIGVLESQKHGLLHELAAVNKEVEDFKVELEKIYGSVNINVEDGVYTPIEKEKE